MKKLFISSLAIVLLGAGCLGGQSQNEPDAVVGEWYLNFDLPEGWVMVDYYTDSEIIPLEKDINAATTDIYLQSTNKTILRGGAQVGEVEGLEADQIESENFLLIHALRLSTRRAIPDDAEDIGGGFFKRQVCEEGEDCQIGGAATHEYYYQSTTNPYQFKVYLRGDYDLTDAERVIMSLEEVEQVNE